MSGRRAVDARVWVLEDASAPVADQAIGIAERLDVPFRRVRLNWNWLGHLGALSPRGSLLGLAGTGHGEQSAGRAFPGGTMPGAGPELILSSGTRAASVGLWLKRRFGGHLVQCMRPRVARASFDLLVVREDDVAPQDGRVLRVLAAPNRISPQALRQASEAWGERLAYMPQPRVALLMGGRVRGSDMPPSMAHQLGRRIAGLAMARGGSVMATTSRRTGAEATEALAAGLAPAMNLLYRWGEPGENPYLGFLALADAIVVTADSAAMLGEACATLAAVHVALPELAQPRQRRLIAGLYKAGYAHALEADLQASSRNGLDEAARVAEEISRLFPLR